MDLYLLFKCGSYESKHRQYNMYPPINSGNGKGKGSCILGI